MNSQQDEIIRICERAKHELIALGLSEAPTLDAVSMPLPSWLTSEQLADYWQLRNKKGEITTSGLLTWAKRGPDEFPLPHAYMGDLIRFPREEADAWAKDEAERRRLAKNKNRGQGSKVKTDNLSDSRLRPALAAVGGK